MLSTSDAFLWSARYLFAATNPSQRVWRVGQIWGISWPQPFIAQPWRSQHILVPHGSQLMFGSGTTTNTVNAHLHWIITFPGQIIGTNTQGRKNRCQTRYLGYRPEAPLLDGNSPWADWYHLSLRIKPTI